MSYNQPPPGPYGQQPPQQPNPYAQQPGQAPQQPQQPNPYGQQPGAQGQQPQAGYGYPPQQPGQPGQQPYGQPGMPGTPQGGGGNGKTIGIVVGALVVVAAIIVGVVLFTGGDDDDKAEGGSGGSSNSKTEDDGGKEGEEGEKQEEPPPAEELKPYKIVPPKTVLAGEYKTTGSGTDDEDLANDPDAKRIGVTDATGASDMYNTADKEQLQLAAVYGTVTDPKSAADGMFDKVHDNQRKGTGITNYKVETVEGPKEYSPEGFDGEVLRCETRKQTGQIGGTDVELIFPTCVWSDSAAVGVVSQMGAMPSGGAGKYGKSMSQDALAEATVKIREDAREDL